MDFPIFRESLKASQPPEGIPVVLQALWYDGRGDWEAAHTYAQQADDRDGAWVHAYLHRKEGDLANAAYWYRRAGQPVAEGSLDDEWASIVEALLSGSTKRS